VLDAEVPYRVIKHPDFTRCVFSPRLVVMAPKKMAADDVEQSEVNATPSAQMTDDVEQPEVQATPSMQMTDAYYFSLQCHLTFKRKLVAHLPIVWKTSGTVCAILPSTTTRT